MYTLEQLQKKTFKELKEIGWLLNALPAGDRRCRQNWIEAIAGVNPPLLQLLETSPGVEVEPIEESIEYGRITGYLCRQEPIEVQRQEPIEVQAQEPPSKFDNCWVVDAEGHFVGFLPATADEYLSKRRSFAARPGDRVVEPGSVLIKPIEIQRQEPIESKFGRVVYPRPNKQVAPAENFPGVDREEAALAIEPAAAFNDEQPPNRGDGRGRPEREPELSQSAISTGITLSDRFLARYSPLQPGVIHYQADTDGQLSLLDFEIQSEPEPPDPDDFDSMFAFWAAYDAWDEAHPEPLEVSLASMCEWAPCPEEWYEPDTNETVETVSCTLEISPVPISPRAANQSSDTCKFLIPVFGSFADRAIGSDEPPTAGVGARLPKPKPPSFPPMNAAAGDRSSIKKFARCAIPLSGRAPPGGDAVQT